MASCWISAALGQAAAKAKFLSLAALRVATMELTLTLLAQSSKLSKQFTLIIRNAKNYELQ